MVCVRFAFQRTFPLRVAAAAVAAVCVCASKFISFISFTINRWIYRNLTWGLIILLQHKLKHRTQIWSDELAGKTQQNSTKHITYWSTQIDTDTNFHRKTHANTYARHGKKKKVKQNKSIIDFQLEITHICIANVNVFTWSLSFNTSASSKPGSQSWKMRTCFNVSIWTRIAISALNLSGNADSTRSSSSAPLRAHVYANHRITCQ